MIKSTTTDQNNLALVSWTDERPLEDSIQYACLVVLVIVPLVSLLRTERFRSPWSGLRFPNWFCYGKFAEAARKLCGSSAEGIAPQSHHWPMQGSKQGHRAMNPSNSRRPRLLSKCYQQRLLYNCLSKCASRKLALWSRKHCGSPRGTWGLRQAVLKGIYDTAHIYIYTYIHVYALLHSYKICFQSNFFCWRPSQPGRLVKATMDNQHDDLGIGLQLLLGLLIFSPRGGHSHTEFFFLRI